MTMTATAPPNLTDRELAVLTGLARGYTRHRIAADGLVHPGTVANIQTRVARKFGVANGNAAVLVDAAYRTGALAGLAPEPRLRSELGAIAVEFLRGYAAGRNEDHTVLRLFLTGQQTSLALREITECLQPRNRAHAVALAHQGGHLTDQDHTA